MKAAAETMRDNPELDEAGVITELGVGEALVSCLDDKGRPGVVERAFIVPPGGQIGPIDAALRKQLMAASLVAGVYEQAVDRESAYEMLKRCATPAADTPNRARAEAPAAETSGGGISGMLGDLFGGGSSTGGRRREGMGEALAKSAARAIGGQVGRAIIRGVLGSILGGRR